MYYFTAFRRNLQRKIQETILWAPLEREGGVGVSEQGTKRQTIFLVKDYKNGKPAHLYLKNTAFSSKIILQEVAECGSFW
ncbi:MAG: hypothetical protein IJ751_08405 [Oscillospiraceae bacterium]|nr:hypothetical protein [Oscillospiraceae bacterium]